MEVGTLRAAESPLVITEFMAANTRTLADEDGDFPDWVEIHNRSSGPVDLVGWSLTDRAVSTRRNRWTFPATNLPPDGFLVVFASGKDRRVAGAPLHTDFKLSREGEAIALFSPDETPAPGSFLPAFPPQLPDISYGPGRLSEDRVLIEAASGVRYVVPDSGVWDGVWMAPEFDDSAWPTGVTGLGYDARPPGPLTYQDLIRTDLRPNLLGRSATVYLRVPFVVETLAWVESLTLEMAYTDGFLAYVNGILVAADNPPLAPAWNSVAQGSRPPEIGGRPVSFALGPEAIRSLRLGTNWLAIQALGANQNAGQFLVLPRLVASRAVEDAETPRYFTTPTPGAVNTLGTRELGPVLHHVSPPPAGLLAGDPVRVTVEALATFSPVVNLELRFRVMFGPEFTLPMEDDGRHGDGLARDGIFGATIPPGVAGPGEMLRWYVVARDTAGRISRLPDYADPTRSPQYLGTMVETNLATRLPVIHWFVPPPDTNKVPTLTGTRCAVFYAGELYDNVAIHIRGTTSEGYWKKSYKLDFNPGQWFQYDPAAPRVEEVNLNTTWSDKSYVRTVLSWEMYRDAGVPYCNSFLTRIQQNGRFHSVAAFVEEPDSTLLQRNGLDPGGAFYKIYNDLSSVAGNQKLYPADADFSDLQALVDGIAASNPGRVAYLFDHVDLAAMVNYLAVNILLHDNDSAAKNYYLHLDLRGTGQWRMFPWDKDLTWGRNYQTADPDRLWANVDTAAQAGSTHKQASPSHPFFGDSNHQKWDGRWNRLVDLLYSVPQVREMFLRRLRTLMDRLLQPPDVPVDRLLLERRLAEWLHDAGPDAELDHQTWGMFDYGSDQSMGSAVRALEQQYLAPRRVHLFQTHNETNAPSKNGSARIPNTMDPEPRLAFGRVERGTASGNPDEQFIELINEGPLAVDLSGWELRGAVFHRFPPGTVIPAGVNLYLSPNLLAFRQRSASPSGGMGLFVQGNFSGRLPTSAAAHLELWRGTGIVETVDLPSVESAAQNHLRIVRLMYRPASPDLEYLELRNNGTEPLDLAGVRFTRGIHFEFPSLALPAPADARARERSVFLVRNQAAFLRHYGSGLRIAGEYVGALDNLGEPLRLEDARGEVILEFRYDPLWQPLTDGVGFPLVHDDTGPPQDWSNPSLWRLGPWERDPGPTGAADPIPVPSGAILSEVIPAPRPGIAGGVEIQALQDMDVGGWFLTDQLPDPRRFRIPPGTLLAAGGFLFLDSFTLRKAQGPFPGLSAFGPGTEIHLLSATPDGRLTGYHHHIAVPDLPPGASLARQEDSVGVEFWSVQQTPTPGATNSPGTAAPVVIARIHYHPPDPSPGVDNTSDEFVELRSLGPVAVPAFDLAFPTRTWQLSGAVAFTFPMQTWVPAGGSVLVVGFDPGGDPGAARRFRARVNAPASMPLVGPWSGKLHNSGGTLELRAPIPGADDATRSFVIDAASYGPGPPWPALADGQGPALVRIDPAASGLSPANWAAACAEPGVAYDPRQAPFIIIPPADGVYAGYANLLAGLLAGPVLGLHYQWRREGFPIPGATQANLALAAPAPSYSGMFDVVLMSAGGVTQSLPVHLEFVPPPVIFSGPAGASIVSQSNYVFHVTAGGVPPLAYQWRHNGTNLPGATTPDFTLFTVDPTREGDYTVVVTDANLSVESRPARISTIYRPVILSEADNWMVNVGESVLLSLNVTGTLPIAYTWRKDFTPLPVPSLPYLLITNAQLTNSGVYSVSISNVATPLQRVFSAGTRVLVTSDSDGDGMPDLWELVHGLAFNNPSDASDDSDGDGFTNLEEYRAGTDPRDAFDYPRIERFERVRDLTRQAMLQFAARSNHSYTIQVSDHPGPPWSNWMSFTALATNRLTILPVELLSGQVTQQHFRLVTPRQP